jgi:hypothetical protein
MHEYRPPSRPYWSVRHGTAPEGGLVPAATMFDSLISELKVSGYLTEWFGQNCVDGDFPGRAGQNPTAYVYRKTRHNNIWPVHKNFADWDADTLYTAIEFFFDHGSKGVDGYQHDYMNCGYHYTAFDREQGQDFYRAEVNDLLEHSSLDFELGGDGVVVRKAPLGLEQCMKLNSCPWLERSTSPLHAMAFRCFELGARQFKTAATP